MPWKFQQWTCAQESQTWQGKKHFLRWELLGENWRPVWLWREKQRNSAVSCDAAEFETLRVRNAVCIVCISYFCIVCTWKKNLANAEMWDAFQMTHMLAWQLLFGPRALNSFPSWRVRPESPGNALQSKLLHYCCIKRLDRYGSVGYLAWFDRFDRHHDTGWCLHKEGIQCRRWLLSNFRSGKQIQQTDQILQAWRNCNSTCVSLHFNAGVEKGASDDEIKKARVKSYLWRHWHFHGLLDWTNTSGQGLQKACLAFASWQMQRARSGGGRELRFVNFTTFPHGMDVMIFTGRPLKQLERLPLFWRMQTRGLERFLGVKLQNLTNT